MGKTWSQSVWIPSPTITEKNVPNQNGKVVIITGANAGVGFELAKILYAANAKVYLACRSKERALEAIRLLESEIPDSEGALIWLPLDLADLASVKMAAEEFQSKEQRLDVLWNNAGVMCTPSTMKSKQGYDLQIGTNVLGPYLLSTLLYPTMKKTAETSPVNTVRVCWASSITIELSPRGGVAIDDSGSPVFSESKYTNYFISKAANNLLASELGKTCRHDNVLSVSFNPGNLDTGLTRYLTLPLLGSIVPHLMSLVMWHPRYGAYTELYAGLSPDLNIEHHSGAYIWPWGQIGNLRPDIEVSLRSEEEGGSGRATRLLAWCKRETASFA